MDDDDYGNYTWGDQQPAAPAPTSNAGYYFDEEEQPQESVAPYSYDTTATTESPQPPVTSLDPQPPKPAIVTGLQVKICNPEKHGEGSVDAYVSYEVVTNTSLTSFSATEFSVRRRYQDFIWLKQELDKDFRSCIVPPLPEKHRMDYLDRFSALFIEKRQAALQRFINRLISHPVLYKSEMLRLFLESKPMAFEALKQSRKGAALSGLGDSIMNAFSKVKFPDSRFVAIAEYNQKLEENLAHLERVHQRLVKRQTDLSEDLTNFGGVCNLLSSEEHVGDAFRKVGQVTDRSSLALKELTESIDLEFMSQLRDYSLYSQSIRVALRERDLQQVEYEELATALETKLHEREAASNPVQTKSLLTSITGPADPQKLQAAIDELQKAVEESSEEQKKFSNEILVEMDHFNQRKTSDFKKIFAEYASNHLQFAQKSLDQWQQILPLIEEIRVD